MPRSKPASRRTAIIAELRLPAPLAAIREAQALMAPLGVPAHVTVLFPFLPVAELDATVLERLKALAASRPAFTATFDRAERRGDIVWLLPTDQRPFLDMTTAVFASGRTIPRMAGSTTLSSPTSRLSRPAKHKCSIAPSRSRSERFRLMARSGSSN